MRYSTFVSCLFFLGFMLVLSFLPVVAHSATNSTELTISDVAPPDNLIATMGGAIGGGLALIWAMRKIIKFVNKS
jgi:hypothetical protein